MKHLRTNCDIKPRGSVYPFAGCNLKSFSEVGGNDKKIHICAANQSDRGGVKGAAGRRSGGERRPVPSCWICAPWLHASLVIYYCEAFMRDSFLVFFIKQAEVCSASLRNDSSQGCNQSSPF